MDDKYEFEKNYNLEKIDENLKKNIDLITNEIRFINKEIENKNTRLIKLRSSLLQLMILNKIKNVKNISGKFAVNSRKSLVKYNLKKEFQDENQHLKQELLDKGVIREWYLLNTRSEHLHDEVVISKLEKYLNYWSNEKYLVHKSSVDAEDQYDVEKVFYDADESFEVCENSKTLVSSCEDYCCQDNESTCNYCGAKDDIGNCCEESEYETLEEKKEQERLNNELLHDIYLDGLEMLNVDEMDISDYEQNTDYDD